MYLSYLNSKGKIICTLLLLYKVLNYKCFVRTLFQIDYGSKL